MPKIQFKKKWHKGHGTYAASRIQKAWAAKKRRKIGLVQRTLDRNYQQIQKLKKAPERKYLDDITGSQVLSGDVDSDGNNSTGLPMRLNLTSGVQVGTGPHARIGREVTMRRMTVHVLFSPPTGLTAESANRCTAVLVHDKEPAVSGGLPTIQELYDLGPATASLNTAFYNPINVGGTGQSEKRYQVLSRKTIWVGSQPNCMPNGYLTLSSTSPYKINYGDIVTASASGLNQTLRLFLYSDSGTAPHPRFAVNAKFSYTDQ